MKADKLKHLIRSWSPKMYIKLRKAWSNIIANEGYLIMIHAIVSAYNSFALRSHNNYDALSMLEKLKFHSDRWVIVASGPSLNDINISLVKDSVIILVNKSFQCAPEFLGRGNKVLCLFTDTHVYNRFSSEIDVSLEVVVFSTKLNFNCAAIKTFSLPNRFLYMPEKIHRISKKIKKPMIFGVHYGLFCIPYYRLRNFPLSLKNSIWINYRTVTLTGAALAIKYNARSIIIFGFDGGSTNLNPNDTNYYSSLMSAGASRRWKWAGWDNSVRNKIDLWAREIYKYCDAHNISILNISPRSHLKSIPVVRENHELIKKMEIK